MADVFCTLSILEITKWAVNMTVQMLLDYINSAYPFDKRNEVFLHLEVDGVLCKRRLKYMLSELDTMRLVLVGSK